MRTIIRESFAWMDAHSGFDVLFNQPCFKSYTSIRVQDSAPLWLKLRSRLQRDRSLESPFCSNRHHATARSSKTQSFDQVLLTVGENQYSSEWFHLQDKSKLFLFLHQPPGWWLRSWDKQVLNGVGGIICLSQQQCDFFKNLAPTLLIQHGVDLDFFKPASDGRLAYNLLFVGGWLRDFRVLLNTIVHLSAKFPHVQLQCVIPKHFFTDPDVTRLMAHPNVTVLSGISGEKLRSLYQNANLLLCPLLDGTANNGIVEALSCGLPVISTDVGGTHRYVNSTTGALCRPFDSAHFIQTTEEWLSNPERASAAGKACRKFAETNLKWETTATNIHAWINSITNTNAK